MGGVSFSEFAGTDTEPQAPVDQAEPKPEAQPQSGMSFDDFQEGRTGSRRILEDLGLEKRAPSGYVEKALSTMKSAGGNAGVLADMVLSAPWFAIAFGANVGNQATGLMFGQDVKTAAQSGRKVQEQMMNDWGNPLHKVMQLLGTNEMYEESVTAEGLGKVAGWIKDAGAFTEKVTGGAIPSEEVETMVDGLMLLGGAKGGDLVKKLWAKKAAEPKDYVPPEVSMEQTQQQGPRSTAQQDINEMLNIRSTRDRKAYDAKRRREVREAFSNDPDYADYLKFHAEERVSNHDNWTKAARESEAREQQARASDDPAIPKPAEPTAEQIFDILNKPGVDRSSSDLIALRRFNEQGYVKPELAARLAALGIGATAGLMLDPEDPIQASILGGAAAVAPTLLMGGPGKVSSKFGQSGAVKGPGGMWHPETVEMLSIPLKDRLYTAARGGMDVNAIPENKVVAAWSDKAIRNYLNKYAGTDRDPLAGVEIPYRDHTVPWESAWDEAVGHLPAERFTKPDPISGTRENFPEASKAPPDEKVFGLKGNSIFRSVTNHSTDAIGKYLSHVGDYLRQNVPAEKLGQYDLVRAVRETAANDARVAKEMEKAQAASTKDLPIHKEYPDGMKWVELKLPEKLTPEQMRSVRIVHEAPPGSEGLGKLNKRQYYEALDQSGKPIKNNYTGESARSGRSPEEAWLAGKLAEEGNQMGHCVGGYCAGVASGESKIFSLRDAKGGSHVTVEVEPRKQTIRKRGDRDEYFRARAESRGDLDSLPDNITQIKGKQNRSPNPEYLPYVQDFVRSGKWGEVGDFGHTGLYKTDMRPGENLPPSDLAALPRPDLLADATRRLMNKGVKIASKEDILKEAGPEYTKAVDEFKKLSNMDKERLAAELARYPHRPPGARGRQEGSIDMKTAAKLAGLAGGAAIGASMTDNKVVGTILGGLTGLMIGGASPKGVASVFRKIWAPDKRIRVEDILKLHDYQIVSSARAINQIQTRVENLAPKEIQRNAISHAIESADLSTLDKNSQEGARIAQHTFAQLADVAQGKGVLEDAIMNYVTHLWKPEQAQGMFDTIFGKKAGFSMSPETRFALKRSVPTLAEGKAKGLVPVTEDISTILGIYGNAISRALANKQLIGSLREVQTPDGQNLLQPSRKAPASYVRIDHPQMMDVRVHPDIAPSLRFIFDNYNPTTVMRGIEGLNMLSKRMNVSFSLFHDKALTDAYVGGSGITKSGVGSIIPNVPGAVLEVARAFRPKTLGGNKYLRELREGGAGDMVDTLLKGGLKFQMGREGAGVEDVTRGSFYSALRDLQAGLDSAAQGAGSPVKGFIKANHYSDKVMWERLHAGSKLSVGAEAFDRLMQSNAKAHERNPQVPLLPREKIAEMAASYTNDIFGGINWRAIAENVGTVWGRDAALALLSPAGRRVGQLLLFAPDWTLSTTRAAIKAFGVSPSKYVEARDAGASVKAAAGKMFTGTGARGLLEPQTVTDLHRQYLVRSAIYYIAVGDAINYAMSGHHLWQNQDPTTIDMGDGRKMQWSKHTMEPVHWLTKPQQQGLNKLGFYPREIASQLLGVDYLSAYGKSPPIGSRVAHAAKSFSPISVQQATSAGSGSSGVGIAGFLGTPIYGKTYAQRQAEKEQKRLQNSMNERKAK